jgi:hypothetical protein
MTERLTAAAGASCADGTFLSVRFGNVLGSRGSVVHTFKEQIVANRPITVTDPEVRRFFMTVEEAIQLVIQAAAVGSSGEVLVLDMGEPVRIEDVARRMIVESGERVDIVYTGLRQGEKLDEVLFNDDEVGIRLHHPMISHVMVTPLHPGRVSALDPLARPDILISMLRDLCRSKGLRADDDPKALEITGRQLVPNVQDHVHPVELGFQTGGPASLARNCGEGRCEMHRRRSDREAIPICPRCSDSSDRHTSTSGSLASVTTSSGRAHE